MSEISIIRMKKVKDMTYEELLKVREDCIRLIKESDHPNTIRQESKYLEKIDKRLRGILDGKDRNCI